MNLQEEMQQSPLKDNDSDKKPAEIPTQSQYDSSQHQINPPPSTPSLSEIGSSEPLPPPQPALPSAFLSELKNDGSTSPLTILTSGASDSSLTITITPSGGLVESPLVSPMIKSEDEDSDIEELIEERELAAKASELEIEAEHLYEQELALMGKLLNTIDEDLNKICDFYALYLHVVKNPNSQNKQYFALNSEKMQKWLETLQHYFLFLHQELQVDQQSSTKRLKESRFKLLQEAQMLQKSVQAILKPNDNMKEEKDQDRKKTSAAFPKRYIWNEDRALNSLKAHFAVKDKNVTDTFDNDWEKLGKSWLEWGNAAIKIAKKTQQKELATKFLYLTDKHLEQPPQLNRDEPRQDVRIARFAFFIRVVEQQKVIRKALNDDKEAKEAKLDLTDSKSLFMKLANLKTNGLDPDNQTFYKEDENSDYVIKSRPVFELINAETRAREANRSGKAQSELPDPLVEGSKKASVDCLQTIQKFLDREITFVEVQLFNKLAASLRPRNLGGKPQFDVGSVQDYLIELQRVRTGFGELSVRTEVAISDVNQELKKTNLVIKELRKALQEGHDAIGRIKLFEKQLKNLNRQSPQPKNFDRRYTKLTELLQKAKDARQRAQDINTNRKLPLARAQQVLLTRRLELVTEGNKALFRALVSALNEAQAIGKTADSTQSIVRSLITALSDINAVDARYRRENDQLKDLLARLETANKNWQIATVSRQERQKEADTRRLLSDFKGKGPSEVDEVKELKSSPSVVDQLLLKSTQRLSETGLALAIVTEQNAQINFRLWADEVLLKTQPQGDEKKQKPSFAGAQRQRQIDIAELEQQHEVLLDSLKEMRNLEADIIRGTEKLSELSDDYNTHKSEMEQKAQQLIEQVSIYCRSFDPPLPVPDNIEEALVLLAKMDSSPSADTNVLRPLIKLKKSYEDLADKIFNEKKEQETLRKELTRAQQPLSKAINLSQAYVQLTALPTNSKIGVRAYGSQLLDPSPRAELKEQKSLFSKSKSAIPNSLPLTGSLPTPTAGSAPAVLSTVATERKEEKINGSQQPLSLSVAQNLMQAIDTAEKSGVLSKSVSSLRTDWDSEWKQKHASNFSDSLAAVDSLPGLSFFLQVKHAALADRDSHELQVPELGRVRVFPPKESMNMRLEADDILGLGLDYTRATLEILKYAKQGLDRQNLAFIKEKLQLFHEKIHLCSMSSPEDRQIMNKALRQLGGALTAVLQANKVCKDHKQAKYAIRAMWKMQLLEHAGKVAFCQLIPQLLFVQNEKPKASDSKDVSSNEMGCRVEFYKQVRVGVPDTPGVKDPWINYGKSKWYKKAVGKLGPWFTQYTADNLETLRTTPTDPALRFLPNPATALDNTAFTVNAQKDIVSSLSRDTVLAFTEPYGIKDEKERSDINRSNYLAVVVGEKGDRLKANLRAFFADTPLPLIKDRSGKLVLPITHHTLVGAPKSDSGKSFRKKISKMQANQAFKDFLTQNVPWLLSDGNVNFYAPGTKPDDINALRIELQIKEINDHVNMWGDVKGYGKTVPEAADTLALLDATADKLKKFENQVPVDIKRCLETIGDFLRGYTQPVFKLDEINTNIGEALKKLTDYLCSAPNELSHPDGHIMTIAAKRELALLTQAATELCSVHRGKGWSIYKHPDGYKPRKKIHEAVVTQIVAKRLGMTLGGCMSSADRKQEIKALEVLYELLFDATHSILTYKGPLKLRQAVEKCRNYNPTQLKHTLLAFFTGTPTSKDRETRAHLTLVKKPGVLSALESSQEQQLCEEFGFTRKFSADKDVIFPLELTDSKQAIKEKKTGSSAETELVDMHISDLARDQKNEINSEAPPSQSDLVEQKTKQRMPPDTLQFLKNTLAEIRNCHTQYLTDGKTGKSSRDNRIDIGNESMQRLSKAFEAAIRAVAKLSYAQKKNKGDKPQSSELSDKNYILAVTKIADALEASRKELASTDLPFNQELVMPITVLQGIATSLNNTVQLAGLNLKQSGQALSESQKMLLEKLGDLEDELELTKQGAIIDNTTQIGTYAQMLNGPRESSSHVISPFDLLENLEESDDESSEHMSVEQSLPQHSPSPPPPPADPPSVNQAIKELINVVESVEVFNRLSYDDESYRFARKQIALLEDLQNNGTLENGHFSQVVYMPGLQAAVNFLQLKLQLANGENQESQARLAANLAPSVAMILAHFDAPLLPLTQPQQALRATLKGVFYNLPMAEQQMSEWKRSHAEKKPAPPLNQSTARSTIFPPLSRSITSLLTPPPPSGEVIQSDSSLTSSSSSSMTAADYKRTASFPLNLTAADIEQNEIATALLSSGVGDDKKASLKLVADRPSVTVTAGASLQGEQIDAYDDQVAALIGAGQSSSSGSTSQVADELASLTLAMSIQNQLDIESIIKGQELEPSSTSAPSSSSSMTAAAADDKGTARFSLNLTAAEIEQNEIATALLSFSSGVGDAKKASLKLVADRLPMTAMAEASLQGEQINTYDNQVAALIGAGQSSSSGSTSQAAMSIQDPLDIEFKLEKKQRLEPSSTASASSSIASHPIPYIEPPSTHPNSSGDSYQPPISNALSFIEESKSGSNDLHTEEVAEKTYYQSYIVPIVSWASSAFSTAKNKLMGPPVDAKQPLLTVEERKLPYGSSDYSEEQQDEKKATKNKLRMERKYALPSEDNSPENSLKAEVNAALDDYLGEDDEKKRTLPPSSSVNSIRSFFSSFTRKKGLPPDASSDSLRELDVALLGSPDNRELLQFPYQEDKEEIKEIKEVKEVKEVKERSERPLHMPRQQIYIPPGGDDLVMDSDSDEDEDLNFVWPPATPTWRDRAEVASSYLWQIMALLGSAAVGYGAGLSSIQRDFLFLPLLQMLAHPLSAGGALCFALSRNMGLTPPNIVRLFLELADARFVLAEPDGRPNQPRVNLTREHQQYLRKFAKLMFDVINPGSEVGRRLRWANLTDISRQAIGATLHKMINGEVITQKMQRQLMELISNLVTKENYLRFPPANPSCLAKISPLPVSAVTFTLSFAMIMLDPIFAGNIFNWNTNILGSGEYDQNRQKRLNKLLGAIICVLPPVVAMASLSVQRKLYEIDNFSDYKDMARQPSHDRNRPLHPSSAQQILDDKGQPTRLDSRVQLPERRGVASFVDLLRRIFAFPLGTLGWLPPDLQIKWVVDAAVALAAVTLIVWNPKNIDELQVQETLLAYFAPDILLKIGDVLRARWYAEVPGPHSSAEFKRVSLSPIELENLNPQPDDLPLAVEPPVIIEEVDAHQSRSEIRLEVAEEKSSSEEELERIELKDLQPDSPLVADDKDNLSDDSNPGDDPPPPTPVIRELSQESDPSEDKLSREVKIIAQRKNSSADSHSSHSSTEQVITILSPSNSSVLTPYPLFLEDSKAFSSEGDRPRASSVANTTHTMPSFPRSISANSFFSHTTTALNSESKHGRMDSISSASLQVDNANPSERSEDNSHSKSTGLT